MVYEPITEQQIMETTNLITLQPSSNIMFKPAKINASRINRFIFHIKNMITIMINNPEIHYITIKSNTYYPLENNIYFSICSSLCYNTFCCINYNPDYYLGKETYGLGHCCCYDIYSNDNYKLGLSVCWPVCCICFPCCLLDWIYKKLYGYSRIDFFENVGNCMLEKCLCLSCENWLYLNILPYELEELFIELEKIIKKDYQYSNLDISLEYKRYQHYELIKIILK
jgi:hypothetical protein